MPKNQFPLLSHNGWRKTEGCFAPFQCTELPAPHAVIALTNCGCQGSCIKTRFSCSKTFMNFTPLCKCIECENTKDYDISKMKGVDEELN